MLIANLRDKIHGFQTILPLSVTRYIFAIIHLSSNLDDQLKLIYNPLACSLVNTPFFISNKRLKVEVSIEAWACENLKCHLYAGNRASSWWLVFWPGWLQGYWLSIPLWQNVPQSGIQMNCRLLAIFFSHPYIRFAHSYGHFD